MSVLEGVPRRWRSRGRVFPGEGTATPAWMGSYAALPHPVDPWSDRDVRVFFSGRDAESRASIAAVTVDLETLRADPASLTAEPLLGPGSLGAFDDSGVTMSCLVPHHGCSYLYYTGWSLGRTVPFYFGIGLAISEDGGRTFERHSAAPILGRHAVDPYLCASPSVLVEGGLWRMWYVSGVRWELRPEGPRHYYLVRYAESADGIEWRRHESPSVEFASQDEYSIGRPHVLRHQGGYVMWYCFRGERYRLGWAFSEDGYRWRRQDDTLILDSPPGGWDDEMQAYPSVLRRREKWWLFYNGNGYGATGFGVAEGVL